MLVPARALRAAGKPCCLHAYHLSVRAARSHCAARIHGTSVHRERHSLRALASDYTVQVGKVQADVGTGRIRVQLRQLRGRRSWLPAPARSAFFWCGGLMCVVVTVNVVIQVVLQVSQVYTGLPVRGSLRGSRASGHWQTGLRRRCAGAGLGASLPPLANRAAARAPGGAGAIAPAWSRTGPGSVPRSPGPASGRTAATGPSPADGSIGLSRRACAS